MLKIINLNMYYSAVSKRHGVYTSRKKELTLEDV